MIKGVKACKFFRDTVKDDGVLRTETAPVNRVFSLAGVSNNDPENPVVVTLAYCEGSAKKLEPVQAIEVEPDGEFYFNPEDYEFDIAPGGYAELHVSAPGGGDVTLSMLTHKS